MTVKFTFESIKCLQIIRQTLTITNNTKLGGGIDYRAHFYVYSMACVRVGVDVSECFPVGVGFSWVV